jgi:ferric-dicitrate binding protein FerR (iron transport regulator)
MSNAFRFLAIFAGMTAYFAACLPAFAGDEWTLVQTVGEVSVTAPGATPVAAKPSMALPGGATVKTGQTGRAVLLRGRETIVMSPSSVLTLPSGANRDFTKVRQVSGTLLFKIGKKPEAHFEVDTPYLAAVVKGTTFTVKVSNVSASVHVLEGAVEVATSDRKNSFLTRAGQISTVFAQAAHDILTTGASILNRPSGNAELWGTDVTGAELGGETSPWSFSSETRVFNDTGLKARTAKPKRDESLTERAPERLTAAAKSVNDTLGAAKARQQTQKPKDESVVVASNEREAERERTRKAKEREADAAQKTEKKAKRDASSPASGPAVKAPNVWTVTQAKGEIKIDGYPFTNFGDGRVRSLPPGTKVETGADSRLGLAYGLREFIIEANSLAVLADAETHAPPMVVKGTAVSYREDSGRYVAVDNLSESEIAALRESGALDNAPSKDAAEAAVQVVTAGGGGKSVGVTPTEQLPKIASKPTNTKTEEVRTKVIGGLTLGLYSLTAVLVLAFGAQWYWRRYRAKKKAQPVESVAETRLRNIKGL